MLLCKVINLLHAYAFLGFMSFDVTRARIFRELCVKFAAANGREARENQTERKPFIVYTSAVQTKILQVLPNLNSSWPKTSYWLADS